MSTNAIPLVSGNLEAIAARGIAVPRYDRRRLKARIAHIGVGGFHRAHLARYLDELAAAGSEWGIRGVGLLDADARIAATLAAQDYLYTLIERDSDETRTTVVGSIVDFALVADAGEAFSRLLSDPELMILSLTITEGGYSLEQRNPTIEAIVSALERRLVANATPLTVLSCDNLPGNGDAARDAILEIAADRRQSLADAITQMCSFPNSMVDRITPQTTDDDRRWLREQGVDDGWPVVCESFRQWVIEDNFAAERPAWDDLGVLMSDRVHDWELYKLRMLNASHSCMAYLMALAGVAYVDEAMAITHVRSYLERLLTVEAIPTLREIPDHPAAEYAATVLHRLANTAVRDQIARLCIDGTAKFPSFLLPTIEAQIERAGPIDCSALALAAWARYLAETPPAQQAPDSRAGPAKALAQQALNEPAAFLELDIFTEQIRADRSFRAAFTTASKNLAETGPFGAIERVLTGI